MSKTWTTIFLFAGVIIIAIAVLDYMNVPLEFPTSSNGANVAIGAGLIATPFLLKKAGV